MTKVVQIITRLIQGGAQAHVVDLCDFLKRDGRFEVSLVAGPPIGPEGELVSRATALGIEPVIVDSLQRAIHPFRDRRARRELRRILDAQKPDVVHTHSAKAGVLGRQAAHAAGVEKIFHTLHGLPFHPHQFAWIKKLGAGFERRGARLSRKIICVGEAMRDAVAHWEIAAPEKVEVIPCGVDLERFAPRPGARDELGLPPDAWLVVTVSRLAVGKGHVDLIRAAALAREKIGSLHLVFVGDGALREDLLLIASGAGVPLTITGMVPPERVPLFLASADVMAHPSWREGMPLALLEGALMQRPLISLDEDGAREIVRHGENGILVAPGTSETLARALVDLHEHIDRFREGAQKGLVELRMRYDRNRTLAEIADLYLPVDLRSPEP